VKESYRTGHVQYCTGLVIDKVITFENAGFFDWHKDRGVLRSNIKIDRAFKVSCKK